MKTRKRKPKVYSEKLRQVMSGIDAASSGIWELDELEVVAQEFIERLENYGKMKIIPADQALRHKQKFEICSCSDRYEATICKKCGEIYPS
jgi:hypothetical protein